MIIALTFVLLSLFFCSSQQFYRQCTCMSLQWDHFFNDDVPISFSLLATHNLKNWIKYNGKTAQMFSQFLFYFNKYAKVLLLDIFTFLKNQKNACTDKEKQKFFTIAFEFNFSLQLKRSNHKITQHHCFF